MNSPMDSSLLRKHETTFRHTMGISWSVPRLFTAFLHVAQSSALFDTVCYEDFARKIVSVYSQSTTLGVKFQVHCHGRLFLASHRTNIPRCRLPLLVCRAFPLRCLLRSVAGRSRAPPGLIVRTRTSLFFVFTHTVYGFLSVESYLLRIIS